MEQRVIEKEHEIAALLSVLGRKLEKGEEAPLHIWVLSGRLACAHRPLRHHPHFAGSAKNLSPAAAPFVIEWASTIVRSGFRSIISLMHQTELAYYAQLPLGAADLIEFYRHSGLAVSHIEWVDPAHSKTQPKAILKKRDAVRIKALAAYDELPKPVLLHCSAGIQRSAPVAAYIWHMRRP